MPLKRSTVVGLPYGQLVAFSRVSLAHLVHGVMYQYASRRLPVRSFWTLMVGTTVVPVLVCRCKAFGSICSIVASNRSCAREAR